MLKKIILFQCFVFWTIISFAQLTIVVTSIPSNTPAGADIYIAGTFNGWNAMDDTAILTNNGNGTYQITLNPPTGEVKYKFTRGGWETVEGNANGGFQPDHIVNYNGTPTTENVDILSWEDLGGGGGCTSSASDNVQVVSGSFYMPQLDRNRRVWIYLPPDYHTSDKYYPVLYAHDGQNLFDICTSAFGEWRLDESLNELFENGDDGVIVVAIDNGGGHRIDEYSPWVNPEYGGGEGDEYGRFIVETLKPHIDANYRTRPQREYTGTMGSSMGALISMYLAIEYQGVFSKAGILSPAFWFSEDAYTHVNNTGKEQSMKFYLMAGEQESQTMVPLLNSMNQTLANVGFQEGERIVVTHADGQHSEWYWAREFPWVYLWLYGDVGTTNTNDPIDVNAVTFQPNPAQNTLNIQTEKPLTDAILRFYSMDGRLVKTRNIQSNSVDISDLENGMYIVLLFSDCMPMANQKIVVER